MQKIPVLEGSSCYPTGCFSHQEGEIYSRRPGNTAAIVGASRDAFCNCLLQPESCLPAPPCLSAADRHYMFNDFQGVCLSLRLELKVIETRLCFSSARRPVRGGWRSECLHFASRSSSGTCPGSAAAPRECPVLYLL